MWYNGDMNIFYLHNDPKTCAEMHNNKHTVKMIIEYAQLMSTAHRLIDGEEYTELTANGRNIKRWRLSDDRESILHKASHINHPSAIWVRQSSTNYYWLFNLWSALMKEYTYRYGKKHACERLHNYLYFCPTNIAEAPFTEPTPAMPDEVKVAGDSIASYRSYYINNKKHLANWQGKINSRPVPDWFQTV
jgi:hypothetical protein